MHASYRYIEVLTAVVALLLLCATAPAQGRLDDPLRDMVGQDFVLAFPPNEYAARNATRTQAVYITSYEGFNICEVTLYRRDGSTTRRLINILDPNTPWKIDVDRFEHELKFYDSEVPVYSAVQIHTSGLSSVVALSRDDRTADAWQVYPVHALGHNYMIMSVQSDALRRYDSTTSSTIISATYPSYFVVTAPFDSTTVRISLSTVKTLGAAGKERIVSLMKGQSYMVMANVDSNDFNVDLTGSIVSANKPVAVIAGQFKAQNPFLEGAASRDVLIDQLPDISSWDTSYVIAPLVKPDTVMRDSTFEDTYTVLASQDSTQIILEDEIYLLNKGQQRTALLTESISINSTRPVLVSITSHTTNRNSIENEGDPSLIIVPGTSHFASGEHYFKILSPENPAYTSHYHTLYVKDIDTVRVEVDGVLQQGFTHIPRSIYSYKNVRVGAGIHRISGQTEFNHVSYGYGRAESYGFSQYSSLLVDTLFVVLKARNVAGQIGSGQNVVVVIDSMYKRYAHPIADLVTGFSFELSWLASICMPNRSIPIMNDSTQMQVLSTPGKLYRTGDTLLNLPVTLTYGTDIRSRIHLHNVSVQGDLPGASSLPVSVTSIDGEVVIDSVCLTQPSYFFDPLQNSINATMNTSGLVLTSQRTVTESMHLSIYDIMGCEVQELALDLHDKTQQSIDTHALPTGVYVWQVSVNGMPIQTGRFTNQ